jgi:hypothetical protein
MNAKTFLGLQPNVTPTLEEIKKSLAPNITIWDMECCLNISHKDFSPYTSFEGNVSIIRGIIFLNVVFYVGNDEGVHLTVTSKNAHEMACAINHLLEKEVKSSMRSINILTIQSKEKNMPIANN